MKSKRKVLIFTYLPSPYQVELFDAIAGHKILDLNVIYVCRSLTTPTARFWKIPDLKHNHAFLDDVSKDSENLEKLVNAANLVIFNYYQHPLLLDLIRHCNSHHKAWCFWGERPGYRQLGFLGTYYRRWKLSELYKSKAPIWGIGQWAVKQYRREFGGERLYFNLPYFSDLSRFEFDREVTGVEKHVQNFLFSGSLIYRKGVDLLANAFIKLAEEFPSVTLTLMGEGVLRPKLEKRLARYVDRVQFIGFQPWETLPKFYQSADILCVPSRYDGWALVVPEGFASGLPVISTARTGAALELIKPDENGWLIPLGSEQALYQAMKDAVLLSPDEYQVLSQAARKSVSKHSLTDGVERFHQAIEETLRYFQ
jgi:glycosyltransferase involved in cell wall biosynthesis